MTRTAAVRATALLATPALACALVFAVAAPAATPKKNAHFSGHTSAPPTEGFRAPVKFAVSSDGKSLENFTFGSFGCVGAGGFRPGVNPYTGHSLVDAGKLKVPANGKFSDKARTAYTVGEQTTTTKMTISGKFSSPHALSGTITFSQVITGSFKTSCGPAEISFSAGVK